MQHRKTMLAASIGTVFFALSHQAHAQAQGLEVKVSGQINRALMSLRDGVQSDTFHVDNSLSGTRLRVAGSAPISPTLRAGAVAEFGYLSNASDAVTFAAQTVTTGFVERHVDVYFEGSWGKISLGQSDGAANGGVEVDLSGTTVAQFADVAAMGGAFAFRNSATGALGPTIAATTSQQDFESRYDRIRYDTPNFNGFTGAISSGTKANNNVQEFALRYSGDMGAMGRLAGAIGYSREDAVPGGVDDKVTGGSISWRMRNGISATFATSKRDITATREGKFNYFKLGYQWGQHAISGDYGRAKDEAAAGDNAKVMGLAYVYTPVRWADIYAAYKKHTLDRPGTSFHDVNILMAGTRLRF